MNILTMTVGFLFVVTSLIYLLLQRIFRRKLKRSLSPATRYYRETEATILGSPEEALEKAKSKLAFKMRRIVLRETPEETLKGTSKETGLQARTKRNDFLLKNGGVIRIRKVLNATLALSSISMTIGLTLIIISL